MWRLPTRAIEVVGVVGVRQQLNHVTCPGLVLCFQKVGQLAQVVGIAQGVRALQAETAMMRFVSPSAQASNPKNGLDRLSRGGQVHPGWGVLAVRAMVTHWPPGVGSYSNR